MSDIYLIYRDSLQAEGYVSEIGRFLNHIVAKIDKSYIDNRIRIGSIEPVFISKDLAYSWMFSDCYDGKLSIKKNSNLEEQLRSKLSAPQLEELNEKIKIKYTLTDEDKALGLELHKIILKKIISDRFSQKFLDLKSGVSALELASWETQKEEAFSNNLDKPLLEALALANKITLEEMVFKVKSKVSKYKLSLADLLAQEQQLKKEVNDCQSIADCHRLRHLKFGISMSLRQMQNENIEVSPATLKITF